MSQQINLFNPVFLEQPKQFSLLTMLQGLALILAGGMLFYGYARYQVSMLDKQLVQSTQDLEVKRALLARASGVASKEQTEQMLQDQVRALDGKLADANELVNNLRSGAVGNTSGYSEYMRAFSRQVVSGLWLTGFKITGDAAEISLSGGVINPELVPAYIKKLGREPVMQGKRFSTMEMQRPERAVGNDGRGVRYVEFTLHSSVDISVATETQDAIKDVAKDGSVKAGDPGYLEKILDPDQGSTK